jgi:hypothetical protein
MIPRLPFVALILTTSVSLFSCSGKSTTTHPWFKPYLQWTMSYLKRSCSHIRSGDPNSSQRLQELDDVILVRTIQFFELLDDLLGLAAVAGDGFEKG